MSETPETDAEQFPEYTATLLGADRLMVEVDFARRLERQRDELATALRPFVEHGTCYSQDDFDRARALLARLGEGGEG